MVGARACEIFAGPLRAPPADFWLQAVECTRGALCATLRVITCQTVVELFTSTTEFGKSSYSMKNGFFFITSDLLVVCT